MHITQLAIYPVKSLRGIVLDQAELTERGLAFDRRWMIVDSNGDFVTQREVSALATITVELGEQHLTLRHETLPAFSLALAEPKGGARTVRVFRSYCEALDEGDEVAAWLASVPGLEVVEGLRLMRFPESGRREVPADYLAEAEKGHVHVAFSDEYPLLIAHQASLDALNAQLEQKGESRVPMTRFRPNVVVEGSDEPFAERDWRTLQGPEYRLGLRKPCKRCKIVTQDQLTGIAPSVKEPLRTLVTMDTQPGWKGAYFGQNAVVEEGVGVVLRVGDVLSLA
jgi:uncharacterized protein